MSLRVKLLGSIIVSTFLAWGIAAYRSFLDTRHEINELFDAHLSESARAILQQAEHERHESRLRDEIDEGAVSYEDHDGDEANDDEEETRDIPEVRERGVLFEKRLYFQLRGAKGEFLVGSMRDPSAPPLASVAAEGFSYGQYRGEKLRVFSAWNRGRTLNVQVAEATAARTVLIHSSVRNVLTPILIMIVPLLLVLGFAVDFALRPMRRLSREVERRTPEDLAPIDGPVPREIRPVVIAINRLFSRLSRAMANERRFTADAAHELRTPLAAIKIQAQVALQSGADEATRNHALIGVSKGVDRATHLVEQLLTLARLDPETQIDGSTIKLRNLVVDVTSGLALDALAKSLDLVVTDGPDLEIQGNEAMLAILVRNLVDNAIRYTPANGFVHVTIEGHLGQTRLIVEDSGSGLSDAQRKRLAERFSRVSRPSGEGSGLGLSIACRIAELHGTKLTFSAGQNGRGLRVEVLFSK